MQAFNFATNFEAVAEAFPDRELIHFRDRRLTYAAFRARCRRLAHALLARGLGKVTPRHALAPWQSGQDHVGLYLYNGNEYLEGMLGAYMARTVPFNVNYRYVRDELAYLFRDAAPAALIYHARFAPMLGEVLDRLDDRPALLQVADDSGEPLLEGAEDYEAVLAAESDVRPPVEPSADDLYMVYTGGTTGMPKGVLWRQHDMFLAAMGGSYGNGKQHTSVEALVEGAGRIGATLRYLPLPPFMHGAAHWAAFVVMHNGGLLVLQDHPERLDPAEVWSLVERERVTVMLIVGDAFAVPLLEELERGDYDVSSLTMIASGGAILSGHLKQRLRARIPGLRIRDSFGSSESGSQAIVVDGTSEFEPSSDTAVASDDLTRLLEPGDPESGWLVRRGTIPLGYLNDAEKTRASFVRIDGERYAVPGDHALWLENGNIRLLGRGSVCINTGGEKVYPEEVEEVLRGHPAVYDAVVVGVPHAKWGQQVTALVQPAPGGAPSLEALRRFAAEQLSSYKLPRALVCVETLVRSPSGKADYRWARDVASARADAD